MHYVVLGKTHESCTHPLGGLRWRRLVEVLWSKAWCDTATMFLSIFSQYTRLKNPIPARSDLVAGTPFPSLPPTSKKIIISTHFPSQPVKNSLDALSSCVPTSHYTTPDRRRLKTNGSRREDEGGDGGGGRYQFLLFPASTNQYPIPTYAGP